MYSCTIDQNELLSDASYSLDGSQYLLGDNLWGLLVLAIVKSLETFKYSSSPSFKVISLQLLSSKNFASAWTCLIQDYALSVHYLVMAGGGAIDLNRFTCM